MGIYDREYYRREGPRFLGALAENGLVCKWLIGINIVCFILQMLLSEPFTNALVLDVGKVLHGQVWRLVTYGFLHETNSNFPWHILLNMLLLFWFGRQVEVLIGSREFLAFYLGGVVVAGLAYMAAVRVGWHNGDALRASGGVMAVLVLAALYHPRQIIYLFFVIPMPIWGFAVFLVVEDAFKLLGGRSGHTATAVHLGGAAFGFVYYRVGGRLTGLLPAMGNWKLKRGKPRLRLYREEEKAVPVPAPAVRATAPFLEDEQLEAQMDAILAKIPRVGMEGLTEGEREVLRRASEAIKRRRG